MNREPERTCIGCGTRRPQRELRRLCLSSEGELQWDRSRRAPGRGAYLCGPGCLTAAVKRRSLGRAFRGRMTGGLEAVQRELDASER
ncbi:MAG TPA: YlxR family protein [Myxococcaceae bacterium]|nr:YlxR family protein [Myxococcaceae bacterium]